MNLVADPILTPAEDEKDAKKWQHTTRKREKLVLMDSKLETRLETRVGAASIGHALSYV